MPLPALLVHMLKCGEHHTWIGSLPFIILLFNRQPYFKLPFQVIILLCNGKPYFKLHSDAVESSKQSLRLSEPIETPEQQSHCRRRWQSAWMDICLNSKHFYDTVLQNTRRDKRKPESLQVQNPWDWIHTKDFWHFDYEWPYSTTEINRMILSVSKNQETVSLLLSYRE